MLVRDFDFYLPPELIAQSPLAERSDSRLMLVDRCNGFIAETKFKQLGSWLHPGDLLVINDSRVIPARLIGRKTTGGEIELLLLEQRSASIWQTLVRPGRRLRQGCEVIFGDGLLKATIGAYLPDGQRLVEFFWNEERVFLELLEELGRMPLPPYINQPLNDSERYQTVYSAVPGSAAAPTAGLHFTKQQLQELKDQGVEIVAVTLQIGLGTFRPVKVDKIDDHEMHVERYQLSEAAADKINLAKAEQRRIIAVGTTSCRVLESAADAKGRVQARSAETGIFITPGYEFRVIDGLITNFHLPKSTLIMLVAALAGRENILSCYAQAVERGYRFFSFGDAMFIADHGR